MKINVTLTIDVNPESWYDVYGNARTPAEVRADVREYIHYIVSELPGIRDSEAKVTLK